MASSAPSDAPGAPPGTAPAPQMAVGSRSRIVVVFGSMIALFVAALDQTVVSTAIPSIVADLGGLNLLPWVFTSYMLTSTIAVPIAGKLGDQFGRKPLFLAGLAIFFASSLGAGSAQSMEQLVLMRGIQGVGGGVIMTTTFAVVADLYSPLERGKVTGLISGTFGLASVIGPVVGGWLTDTISWRWIFYVNLPIIAVAFLVILVVVPFMRTSTAKPKIDMIGAVLLANMMVPLLLALVWGGNRYAWDSVELLSLFGVAGVMFVLFILAELSASDPMLPPHLFKNRTFTVAAIATMMTGAGMFGAITMVPLFLQGVKGVAATSSGSLTAPMSIGIVVSSALAGLLITKTGRYRIQAVLGMALVAVGLTLFSMIDRETSEFVIVRNMVIVGLGMGATFPVFSVAVQNALPMQYIGVATSSVQFFRSVGGTLGVAVFTGLMLNRFRDGVAEVAATAPAIANNADAFLNEQGVARVREVYEATSVPGAPPFDQILVAIQTPLAEAIAFVFLIGAIVVGLGVFVTALIPEIPLRTVSPADMIRQMQQEHAESREPEGLTGVGAAAGQPRAAPAAPLAAASAGGNGDGSTSTDGQPPPSGRPEPEPEPMGEERPVPPPAGQIDGPRRPPRDYMRPPPQG